MSLQIGNDKIKEIYYGSDKIKEIYYGSELVYSETGIITPNEFHINASGFVPLHGVYFLTAILLPGNTRQFQPVPMSLGINTFPLPVTASTPLGSSSLLNEGDTLHVYKENKGGYQLIGSILLAKGQTYNLTF